jgi:hypothetical protein
MAFWSTFWGIVLGVGMVMFTVLAVVVTVGGFGDVKAMFQGIERQHGKEMRDDPPSR